MGRFDIYRPYLRIFGHSVRTAVRSRLGLATPELAKPPHVGPDLGPPPEDAPVPVHDWWGANAEALTSRAGLGWLDSQYVVDRYAMPMAFGPGFAGNWGAAAMARFGVPKDGYWLSLGCGGGGQEISFGALGLYARMDAFDYSERAIEVGRKIAADMGVDTITFGTMDANNADLPPNTYDVVHMNMSLHHVERLEHLLWQIRRTVKDGGWVLLNEYIGPSQFQYTPAQINAVRELLDLLPDRLRFNYVAKYVKRQYPVYSRSHWNDFDPTEAVRSDDIPHAVRIAFPNVVQGNYAGGILNMLLENIIGNFDLEDPNDRAVFDQLLWADKTLTAAGVFPHNFSYFAAQKAPSRLADLRAALAARLEWRYRVTMPLRRRGLA